MKEAFIACVAFIAGFDLAVLLHMWLSDPPRRLR